MNQSHVPDWRRIIVHADMDAFFAAVEQLDNPDFRGKPLLIGSRSARSVVSSTPIPLSKNTSAGDLLSGVKPL